jgi:hypothetical protein
MGPDEVGREKNGGDPELFRAVMSAFDRLKKTRKKT